MIIYLGIICGALTATANAETEHNSIVYFDMAACISEMPDDTVLHYDALKLVSALQGLVNREAPRLFIRFLQGSSPAGTVHLDDYWFEKKGRPWLSDPILIHEHCLVELLARFSAYAPGWVIWDPRVPATANVAATMCGIEGLLPMRDQSPLLDYLQKAGLQLPVKRSLTGMFDGSESGSAKCDAYLWAKREYLDTGRCNPALMAFYIDAYSQQPHRPGFHYTDLPNSTVANHDYFISERAFFFDLLVWNDEKPVDDPGQPLGTDYNTLVQLLQSQYKNSGGKQFTSIGGFVSWDLKYTNHGPAGGNHEPVPTEWQYVALFSAYNAILDADALGLVCLPNASAYRHYPLRRAYKQQARPSPPPLEDKTYVLVYMGDYDSAAWMSRHIPSLWDDPARGEIPIAWAFNPNLSDRIPHVFDYVFETATPNDWFIGGDSGAGYLNPNLLTGDRLQSGLLDALTLWEEHNKRYYSRFDYSITGFVINGFHGKMPLRIQESYARFSPDGVGMQLGFEANLVNETPFIRHVSDIYPRSNDLSAAADEMARFVKPGKPQFLVFRWILQSPSTLKAVMQQLEERHPDAQWNFPDPYTFFNLYRQYLKK